LDELVVFFNKLESGVFAAKVEEDFEGGVPALVEELEG
jgi:hypothetical protein